MKSRINGNWNGHSLGAPVTSFPYTLYHTPTHTHTHIFIAIGNVSITGGQAHRNKRTQINYSATKHVTTGSFTVNTVERCDNSGFEILDWQRERERDSNLNLNFAERKWFPAVLHFVVPLHPPAGTCPLPGKYKKKVNKALSQCATLSDTVACA